MSNDRASSVVKSSSRFGNDLIIDFVSGARYRYLGAAKEFNALNEADSKGSYLNSSIKPAYAAEVVS